VAKPKALLQVGGVHGMARSLQNLAREGQGDTELDKKMRAASKAAAEKIIPYAKAAVPVRTGALQRTIKADATRRYGRIIAGTPTRVPYALAVHRGRYFEGSKKRTKGTKFLSTVIPKAFPQIVDEYVKAMNEIAADFQRRHGVDRIYRARR
tara:strand:+ start:456 stop:911 length:456 start_codon:yes stop_codon:yes gene_type:complete